MDSEKLDKLIDLSQRRVSLLKELKESLVYEKCLWHIVSAGHGSRFFLVEIKTGQVKVEYAPTKMKSWLRLHNIVPETVFCYGLLVEPERLHVRKEWNEV